ncbi:Sodium:solute symporter family [Popillia japonica]|uniref:Sodium:solute symporter family n=1 Tax=Popillia japonica TaxID=7064 RepID=A0AAW1KRG0_POPJA
MVGLPADVYKYGITCTITLLVIPLVMLAGSFVFLPVFYNLQITSIYEYLSLRFCNKTRIFASILFTIYLVLFLPIVTYVPALALAQVTGANIHWITPIVCIVCIFYTALGGLKAVVWTDVLQLIVMVGSLIMVLIAGIISVGGFEVLFRKSYEGNRLDVSFDINPLIRDTFWTAFIGNFFMYANHINVSQSFVQKCLALPSYRAVKIATSIAIIGITLLTGLSQFIGLVLFANYFECDPLEDGVIASHDQLLPLFLMEVAHFMPGLAGLFVSGIFSAALSTLSAALNCLAATVYEDFISSCVPRNTSQKRIGCYLKILVVVMGIISMLLVYIVEQLEGLWPLTFSFAGVTSGPLLGLFSVGMLIPMVNEKGALSGSIITFLLMIWIVMKSQWYRFNKMIFNPILPVTTNGCNGISPRSIDESITQMSNINNTLNTNEVFVPHPIYRVSMFWYTFMGFCIFVVVSVVVSTFTNTNKPVKKDRIAPFMQRFLKMNEEGYAKYDSVDNAIELTNAH